MEQNGNDRPGADSFHQAQLDVLQDEARELNTETFEQKIARELDPEIKAQLQFGLEVAHSVKERGGKALVVGGYARDEALRRRGYNLQSKDIDIEIYGLPFVQIQALAEDLRPGQTNIVGEAFGVLKIGDVDISLPRRDSKIGSGHRGFEVEGDPNMSVREAARRRDFTINALALNPLTGELIDEYGGLVDLKQKILRATDPELFADDPLRVLRAMQFAGRFDFSIDHGTAALCQAIDLHELPPERVGEEWRKLLTKGIKPSTGLEAARELNIISQLHPELEALIDVPQEAEWHPEGDVWIHTKMVVDAACEITDREGLSGNDKYVIMLAALCHDLGKPTTTEFNEDRQRITSRGHSEAGAEPTVRFLKSIDVPEKIIAQVVPLVREHLYPTLYRDAAEAAVRRLARRLHPATINQLILVSEADHFGRTLPRISFPQGAELFEKATRAGVFEHRLAPVISGRHLIAEGLAPGPHFTPILQNMMEAQEEGAFSTEEEGITYLRKYLLEHPKNDN